MYIKLLKTNELSNLTIFFKKKIKLININNDYIKSKYMKKLYKDPIQLFFELYLKNNSEDYWLLIDPVFSPVNKKGNQVIHSEKIYNDEGYVWAKGSVLEDVLGTLLGDNTTIVIYKSSFPILDFKKLDFQNDWEKGKIKAYCECVDTVYWEIISNNKILNRLKEIYVSKDFETTLKKAGKKSRDRHLKNITDMK